MKMTADMRRDGRTGDKSPGGYEWWYFDAMDTAGDLRLVVIFYEGNPFSRRYMEAQERGGARPEHYPAVSISLYEGGETLYYSFTEHLPADARFAEADATLQVGGHRVEAGREDPRYRLLLSEKLPSGDALEGELEFRGPAPAPGLFGKTGNGGREHAWNLAMPRARVQGSLALRGALRGERRVAFEGLGYHDHNTGAEPMREEFREWHWGRYHFEAGTLVFYAMDDGARGGEAAERAWLISPDGGRVAARFGRVRLEDRQRTLFGLHTARRMVLEGGEVHCTVQHEKVLDSGPFYQRYASRAFLRLPGQSAVEAQPGIAEYLCPSRIHRRLFWPLVDMRIRYLAEGSHWVQRSPRLYRWTW